MSDPPQRQQPPIDPGRLSDIRFHSYEVPDPSPIAGRGTVREEIEVHVHPGATNFQLANMRATDYRSSRPPTRRTPEVTPGTPQLELDRQVGIMSRIRARRERSSGVLVNSNSGAIYRRLMPDSYPPSDNATSTSDQNVPDNTPIAAGSPAHMRFLERFAAAGLPTPSSDARPRIERPATPRPAESFSPTNNLQQVNEFLRSRSLAGLYIGDGFLRAFAGVDNPSGSPQITSAQLVGTAPRVEASSDNPLREQFTGLPAGGSEPTRAILGNEDDYSFSSRPNDVPEHPSTNASHGSMPDVDAWYGRGRLMRQRNPNSLEDVRSQLGMLENNRQNFQQPGENTPFLSTSVSPAAAQAERERNTQDVREEDVSPNFIPAALSDGQTLELRDVFPPDVLALIAADPNIESRSLEVDIGWIGGYTDAAIPHLSEYRRDLLPDGTVDIHQPPVITEAAARRRAENDERVRIAGAAQAEDHRVTPGTDLAARLALPADVEMPSSSPVSPASISSSPSAPETNVATYLFPPSQVTPPRVLQPILNPPNVSATPGMFPLPSLTQTYLAPIYTS